jgi:cytochrome c oxidase subunit 4
MRGLSRTLIGSWIALLALLGLTVTLAYQPLGSLNGPLSLAIAACKVLVIAMAFMELRGRRPLAMAAALVGIFWLAILLWLSSTDYTQRGSHLQVKLNKMSDSAWLA